MSGHSRWSTIKRKKGATDARRSSVFTKIIKEINVAVKLGGPNPDSNTRLRLAIQNGKSVNIPKDNVDRAIKKAAGADAESYLETTYEGYGPARVALFVECTTDNLNRTLANVRLLLSKNGGSLGTNGSLDFIFEQKGVFNLKLPAGITEDDLTLELIDAGAEDVEAEDGYVTVTCVREDFGSVQKKLDELKIEPESGGLERVAKVLKQVSGEDFKKVKKLIDALEDDDDVQKVYHNIELTEELAQLLDE
jgi:YebC/PmpR family DNA-binding regulatory protein